MRPLVAIAAALAAALAMVAPAAAVTIPVSIEYDSGSVPGSPSLAFYTLDTSFVLPSGFSNASLNLTAFSVDDRAVLQLNGTNVASTGIFGPGLGTMVLVSGGPNDPFTFEYGNSGPFVAITGPFVVGLNSLRVVVNETLLGIHGDLNSTVQTHTSVSLEGTVTFGFATPLPAALPLFATGLGAMGLLGWRKRRKADANIAV